MRFSPTPLVGVWEIELEPIGDERGWFARGFDRAEFESRGLCADVVQVNASFNAACGTLRGMHYQRAPYGEPKLVRCVRGRVFDVAVDVRPGSATLGQWHGAELAAGAGRMLYIEAGLAHGFQTLEADTELLYLMGHHHVSEAATGVRWDDQAFAIAWPRPPAGGRVIAQRDASYPDFVP